MKHTLDDKERSLIDQALWLGSIYNGNKEQGKEMFELKKKLQTLKSMNL